MPRICIALFALGLTIAAAYAAPDKTVLRAQEGASALLRGKFEQAIAIYDEALQEQNVQPPRLASLYSDRGVAKWRLERYEEALQDFNKAVEVYPQFASTYNNRGNVLLDMDRPEEALKEFDKAIALSTGYAAAYNNRGNANEQLGRYDAAVEDYRRATEFMPENAVPYNGRGKALGALGRPYSALRYLTRAITLNGKYPAAYRNRATVYLHLERPRDAITDFDRVISLAPDDPELYLGRGRAWLKEGKSQSAYKDFSKVIELDPENAAAYVERGGMAADRRQAEQALEDLNQAINLDGDLADARLKRANIHFITANVDAALSDLEKAISIEPRYAEAFQLRAEIQESRGQIDQALADYRKAIEIDPFLDIAREAITRLTGTAEDILPPAIGNEVSGWTIISPAQGRFVSTNPRFPKIRIVLEMHGNGTPELLEWTLLKDSLNGIGLLRYYAGDATGGKRTELVVIVDTSQNQVVSIEPYVLGEAKARWDWTATGVTVTDVEGLASAYELRKPKPVAVRRYDDDGWGFDGWGAPPPRSYSRQNRQPKNVFDWLFR